MAPKKRKSDAIEPDDTESEGLAKLASKWSQWRENLPLLAPQFTLVKLLETTRTQDVEDEAGCKEFLDSSDDSDDDDDAVSKDDKTLSAEELTSQHALAEQMGVASDESSDDDDDDSSVSQPPAQ